MMRRILARAKGTKAPEVEEAERTRAAQFSEADEVLKQVATIQKAASTIAQYAQADQLRRGDPPR